MPARRLTYKQKRHWNTDGYVLLRGLLSATEVRDLTWHVDRLY